VTTATAEKLTPAQTALLDRIILDGPVYGVAVPKDADEANLNTARALVRKGLLTESQDGGRAAPKFDLVEVEYEGVPTATRDYERQIQILPETPPQEGPLSRGLKKLATALRRLPKKAARTARGLTHPELAPHYTDPNKRAQKVKAKARRRAKNRVAAKSRRVNRLRSR
jgi:hypothetical protein